LIKLDENYIVLIKNAEKSDPDYDDLVGASKSLTEMLEFINEYKRRKDLINKYLANNEQAESSIADKMKKLNMHTIRKKSNRFRMGLSNMLGLMSTHVRLFLVWAKNVKFSLNIRMWVCFEIKGQ
jgi:hypothetical protein